MDLEGLLFEKLANDSILTGMLAGFNGGPAIFAKQAPLDTDQSWEGDKYPRVAYVVSKSEEPQKGVNGAVIFNIWCLSRSTVHPKVIEARLNELLNGEIFHPDNEQATGLRWRLSYSLAEEDYEANGQLVMALTVKFDLIIFPIPAMTGPDLISVLNQWTEEAFFEAQVDPCTWILSDLSPAIYWRIEEMQIVEQNSAASWMEAQIAAFIIAPTQGGRASWVKKIMERLSLVKTLNLADGSPLFFQTVKADNWSDYLRAGQIKLTVKYGVIFEEQTGGTYEKLNNAVLDVM